MARFQIRRQADQGGSYVWQHVVRQPEGLALGNMYRRQGDDLTTAEALELRRHCARAKYDVRQVRP